MKKYIFVSVLLLIVSSGCSMNRNGASSAAKYEWPEGEYEMASYNAPHATAAPARGGSSDAYLMGDAPAPMPSFSADRDATVPAPTGLMFIKTANIALSAEYFDNAVNDLRYIVSAHGGFFESSNLYNNMSAKTPFKRLYATVRVPADQYEATRLAVERLGRHISTNESSREVSSEYYDLESRIRTKKTEEARLLDLIDQAKELYQIIELEQRLGQVRADVEIYQSRLMQIDSLASYSTIYIDISEETGEKPPEDENFWERIVRGFKNSAAGTLAVLQGIVVFIAYVSVPAVILGIFAAVAVFILKRFKKRGA